LLPCDVNLGKDAANQPNNIDLLLLQSLFYALPGEKAGVIYGNKVWIGIARIRKYYQKAG